MPVMGSFKGLLARLKSPGTKQQQQHNSEAADIDVVKVSACYTCANTQSDSCICLLSRQWKGAGLVSG
jgi:hypothetical protein